MIRDTSSIEKAVKISGFISKSVTVSGSNAAYANAGFIFCTSITSDKGLKYLDDSSQFVQMISLSYFSEFSIKDRVFSTNTSSKKFE